MDAWNRMIAAQGGDPHAPLPTARETHVVVAERSGVLARLDALAVGVSAWRLGAGRARKEDPVSAGAGIEMHAKPGDLVVAGAPLLTLHADDGDRFARALEDLVGGVEIADEGTHVERLPLVLDRIGA
jgi:thymidine phosphorylase